MKNIFKALMALLLIVGIIGCGSKSVKTPEKIKIGVVETTGTKKKSKIHWYDENFKKIDVQNLNYASLGNTFTKPVYYDDQIFLIPQGYMTSKNTEKVISIDKKDFKITEFDVPNIALNDVAVTDKYIFVNSNLNYQSHLSRVNRETKEFTEKIYEGAYFNTMISIKDKLYLFGNKENNIEEYFMYVIDEEFNTLTTIELTDFGTGAYKFLLDEADLYVSLSFKIDDSPNRSLLKINLDNYKLETLDFKVDYLDSIVKHQDTLIISHNDIISGSGSSVTVLNKENNDFESYNTHIDLYYMDIYKDNLVVADQNQISMLDISNNFKITKEVSIDKSKDTYISALIIIE